MKKMIFSLVALALLSGCKNDQGKAFLGVWKNSDPMAETLTVTRTDSGYRAISRIDKDTNGYMKVESVLVAESDALLTTGEKRRALELSADGKTIKSYLRNQPDTFTKVQ